MLVLIIVFLIMPKPSPLKDLIDRLGAPKKDESVNVINGVKIKNSFLVAFVNELKKQYPPEIIIDMLLSLDESVEKQNFKE